ncbi:MAG: DUF4332 domain-containing protein, partial [Hyphomicrobiaceae bacterium]
MSLLFSVLYAAHARGTHHKLAFDGLRFLDGPDAERWTRVFLKHAEPFMEGAKAPDNVFKDFKNHVLHPREGFWGGAPETARLWYDKLLTALQVEDWPAVAYTAGVLSHYVTDPAQPFHTAQSEAENAIHRAFEWSTSKSYPVLWKMGADELVPAIVIPSQPEWVQELIRQTAAHSNRYYEKLIAHYDINKGVVDPPSGLDHVSQRILARLLRTAATLYSAILQRAIVESGAQPPEVSLTVDTVLATLQIPQKWLLKRMEDSEERKLVEQMYDELRETGTVETNLSEDDRQVRTLYAREVLAPRLKGASSGRPATSAPAATAEPAQASTARSAPASSGTPAVLPPAQPPRTDLAPMQAPMTSMPIFIMSGQPAPANETTQARTQVTPATRPTPAETTPSPATAKLEPAKTVESSETRSAPPKIPANVPPALKSAPAAEKTATTSTSVPSTGSRPARPDTSSPRHSDAKVTRLEPSEDRERGPRLKREDNVVDAPSIGPRMAERLEVLGITTVDDLLKADAARIANDLKLSYVNTANVADWQAQTTLVCTVADLTGTGAQLFVGAGYRTVDAIAEKAPEKFCADLLKFAGTYAGQRILRNVKPPDVARIKAWAEAAR